MLEEQLRDVCILFKSIFRKQIPNESDIILHCFVQAELRAEERITEEQKRHRELLSRVEREAFLQNENCQIKIRTIEIEANNLREDIQRLRTQYDKTTAELRATEEKLEDASENFAIAQEELNEAKQNERK